MTARHPAVAIALRRPAVVEANTLLGRMIDVIVTTIAATVIVQEALRTVIVIGNVTFGMIVTDVMMTERTAPMAMTGKVWIPLSVVDLFTHTVYEKQFPWILLPLPMTNWILLNRSGLSSKLEAEVAYL